MIARMFERMAQFRHGSARPLPATIRRRDVYILPTNIGWALLVVVMAGLMAALNYNSNEALLLSLVLGGVVIGALVSGQKQIENVRVLDVQAESGHEGEGVAIRIEVQARPGCRGLVAQCDQMQGSFTLDKTGRGTTIIEIPGTRRGFWQVPQITLTTRWPLGCGTAWAWLAVQSDPMIIWPGLEENPAALPPTHEGDHSARHSNQTQQDIRSLRPYRAGDPLRQISWKSSARTGQVLVREYDQPEGRAIIDYDQLTHLGHESRLRRMATWIVEAERGGRTTLLRLPHQQIGPGRGLRHKVACLNALAEMPHA